MKILQVIPRFNPVLGGGVNVVYNVSKFLARRGHDVTIITTNYKFDEQFANTIRNEGAKVIPFNYLFNYSLFIPSPDMKKWLHENIKDYDLIHLHGARSYQNNIVYKYARRYTTPYILQPHGSLPIIVERKNLKRLYDLVWGNKILKDASKILVLTDDEIKQAKKVKVEDQKIVKIPNGIDVDYFKNLPERGILRKRLCLNDEKIILYLGRIHRRKGVDFLVKAFSELINEIDNTVLVIGGRDDGFKKEVAALISKLGISEKVKFTGQLEDPRIAYVDADILVYPSIYEIYGLVPLEAIMSGIPVIVDDTCGIRDVIKEGNCGYLVKYGDVEDLKEKMKILLKNSKLRQDMVKGGRLYIGRELSWENMVKKVEDAYGEVYEGVQVY